MGADGDNLAGLVNVLIILQVKAQPRVEDLHVCMVKFLGNNWRSYQHKTSRFGSILTRINCPFLLVLWHGLEDHPIILSSGSNTP